MAGERGKVLRLALLVEGLRTAAVKYNLPLAVG
jgi:hypothetical protein